MFFKLSLHLQCCIHTDDVSMFSVSVLNFIHSLHMSVTAVVSQCDQSGSVEGSRHQGLYLCVCVSVTALFRTPLDVSPATI